MAGFLPVADWGLFPSGDGPFLVAGPCSAESRRQVLAAAAALRTGRTGVFRCGLWKPRTHPGGFEGVGLEGLGWLLEARRQTGLKICTEVGTASHAEACLEAGVDMIWIGARTTANPFQVQEICDALRGYDVPVLVKNPVSPDLDLWIGAVERLQNAGISRIGVVLRGFTTLDKTQYRNTPVWEMSTRIRTRLAGMPLFVDPSHMAGDSRFVKELSQKALDLGADGLMVEVHPNPKEALSDAAQQLSPSDFDALVHSLVVRTPSSSDEGYLRSIEELRSEIDDIDSRLLSLLKDRMMASRSIGLLKKRHNISILQTGRWGKVLSSLRNEGASLGLDPSMTERIFSVIHEYSVKAQE